MEATCRRVGHRVLPTATVRDRLVLFLALGDCPVHDGSQKVRVQVSWAGGASEEAEETPTATAVKQPSTLKYERRNSRKG